MTTNKGNRAGKKTTQRKPKELALLLESQKYMTERIERIADDTRMIRANVHSLCDYFKGKGPLEGPTKDGYSVKSPEQEPRVEPKFKEGDWVVSDTHYTAILEKGTPYRVKEAKEYTLAFDIEQHNDLQYAIESFRPATPEEIATYEREQAWKGVTELQENDCCDATETLQAALVDIGLPVRSKATLTTELNINWRKGVLEGGGANRTYELPESEFLRRARGTADRLKKEAEEKELAIPLEFGARVRQVGEREDITGLYLYPLADLHIIAWEGAKTTATMCRDQFTVIPK